MVMMIIIMMMVTTIYAIAMVGILAG